VSQGPFDPSLFKAEGVVLTEGTSSASPFPSRTRRKAAASPNAPTTTSPRWSHVRPGRSRNPAGLVPISGASRPVPRARPCPVSGSYTSVFASEVPDQKRKPW